jgi:hypothetical protein
LGISHLCRALAPTRDGLSVTASIRLMDRFLYTF